MKAAADDEAGKVTVGVPSGKPLYHHGSPGTVVTMGTKRVHVRMGKAAFEGHDAEVANFLPGDLDPGLGSAVGHGTGMEPLPRPDRGWDVSCPATAVQGPPSKRAAEERLWFLHACCGSAAGRWRQRP